MEGQPLISADVVGRYAVDAALEVDGVVALADGGPQRRKAIVVSGDEHAPSVALHLELEWGRSASEVGSAVQHRVSRYLERMTGAAPSSVDVAFASVGSPPPAD